SQEHSLTPNQLIYFFGLILKRASHNQWVLSERPDKDQFDSEKLQTTIQFRGTLGHGPHLLQ
ncbi:MAG: hypothetical protein VXZ92_06850, partial [SAR324 cluster bacterium]|nr:hypothetical protein [SAR324 cluster bacterium]